jgi:serine/threonine protein phosphatase PrpC
MPPKIEMDRAAVERGDGYILCSDGVWSRLSLQELTQGLCSQDLNAAAQNLVSTATQRGGDHADNASVVLLRFGLPSSVEDSTD